MKNACLFTTLIAVITLISSCNKTSNLIEVTHIPVKIKENGNWSLLELKTGKIFFDGEFKNEPSVVKDGIFITQNDEGEYFYNKIESEKMFKEFAGPYVSAKSFTEGIAIVCKEDDYVSAINIEGEEVFKLKPEKGINFEMVGQCFEGMIIFRTSSGYLGYLNKKGKVAIKPEYEFAEDFKDGYARVSKIVKGKDKIQIIDKLGQVKTVLNYSFVGNVDAGIMAYSNARDEYGVVDVNKETVILAKSKFKKIIVVNGDIFYSSNDCWGMLDRNGEILIRAKYKYLSRINNERFLGIKSVGDNTKYEVLDLKGDVLKSQVIVDAISMENGYIIVYNGENYEIKNQEGEAVYKGGFSEVEGFQVILKLSHKISDFSNNQYFDWNVVKNSLKQLGQESFFGVKLLENCIEAEKHIASISIGNKLESTEEIHTRGMAIYGKLVRLGINSIYFAGSGYQEEESDIANDRSLSENYDVMGDPVASINESEPLSNLNIIDNAPEWTMFQRSLEKNIPIGRNSKILFEVCFNNDIKIAIRNPVNRTVKYEKNVNSKVNYMSVSYDIEVTKMGKMKKLLNDFIKSKGLKIVSESEDIKYYTDSKNNSWTLDGISIILEK